MLFSQMHIFATNKETRKTSGKFYFPVFFEWPCRSRPLSRARGRGAGRRETRSISSREARRNRTELPTVVPTAKRNWQRARAQLSVTPELAAMRRSASLVLLWLSQGIAGSDGPLEAAVPAVCELRTVGGVELCIGILPSARKSSPLYVEWAPCEVVCLGSLSLAAALRSETSCRVVRQSSNSSSVVAVIWASWADMEWIAAENPWQIVLADGEDGNATTPLLYSRPIPRLLLRQQVYGVNEIDFSVGGDVGYNLGNALNVPRFLTYTHWPADGGPSASLKYRRDLATALPDSLLADYARAEVSRVEPCSSFFENEYPRCPEGIPAKTILNAALREYARRRKPHPFESDYDRDDTLLVHLRSGDRGVVDWDYVNSVASLAKQLKMTKVRLFAGVHRDIHYGSPDNNRNALDASLRRFFSALGKIGSYHVSTSPDDDVLHFSRANNLVVHRGTFAMLLALVAPGRVYFPRKLYSKLKPDYLSRIRDPCVLPYEDERIANDDRCGLRQFVNPEHHRRSASWPWSSYNRFS